MRAHPHRRPVLRYDSDGGDSATLSPTSHRNPYGKHQWIDRVESDQEDLQYELRDKFDVIPSRNHREYSIDNGSYTSDDGGGGVDDFDSMTPTGHFGGMIKTGRHRKKSSARSRFGEFMSKRRKRRVYFCCIGSEIDVEKLNDQFAGGQFGLYGKLFNDVLYLFQNKDVDEMPRHRSYNNLSTTDESDSSGSGKRPAVEPVDSAANLWHNGLREVYVFDFGCIIFWGYSRGEETLLVREISQYCRNKLSAIECKSCEDDMAFIVDPTERLISIENDVISLPEDCDIKSRLSISFAIAQSAVLALNESRVDIKIQEYKHIPKQLATSGKIKMDSSQLSNMIGDVFVIRHHINLNSEIMSTPDFFWREDEAVLIYRMSMGYLEMENRAEVLNTRLGMLKDLLEVLQHQYENEKGSHLEWIVIWLIMASIILELFSITIKHLVRVYMLK